jgi:hypothetical protein
MTPEEELLYPRRVSVGTEKGEELVAGKRVRELAVVGVVVDLEVPIIAPGPISGLPRKCKL